jgi:hypothetical protein
MNDSIDEYTIDLDIDILQDNAKKKSMFIQIIIFFLSSHIIILSSHFLDRQRKKKVTDHIEYQAFFIFLIFLLR